MPKRTKPVTKSTPTLFIEALERPAPALILPIGWVTTLAVGEEALKDK